MCVYNILYHTTHTNIYTFVYDPHHTPKYTSHTNTKPNTKTHPKNSISDLATAEEAYAKATHKMVKKSGYHPTEGSDHHEAHHGAFRRCMEVRLFLFLFIYVLYICM